MTFGLTNAQLYYAYNLGVIGRRETFSFRTVESCNQYACMRFLCSQHCVDCQHCIWAARMPYLAAPLQCYARHVSSLFDILCNHVPRSSGETSIAVFGSNAAPLVPPKYLVHMCWNPSLSGAQSLLGVSDTRLLHARFIMRWFMLVEENENSIVTCFC